MGVRLPPEYQETEWIGSSGDAYINTGVLPSATDVYSFQGTFRNIDDAVLFGSRSSGTYRDSNQLYLNRSGIPKTTILLCTSSGSRNNIILAGGNRQNAPLDITANDVSIVGRTESGWNPSQPIYLLGFNTLGSNNSSVGGGKLFFFKIDGRCEFIPCYRKADSEPGMYDIVSGTFYTNAGTGEFLVGPDVIDSVSPWLIARRRALMARKTYKNIAYLETVNSQANIIIPRSYFAPLANDECELTMMATTINNGDNAISGWQSEYEIYINKTSSLATFIAWNSSTFIEQPPSPVAEGVIYTLRFKFKANLSGLRLFSYNGNAVYLFTGRIYSYKVTRNNEVVLNFIPRISEDGVPGMYETVNGGFFPSRTNVPFITP